MTTNKLIPEYTPINNIEDLEGKTIKFAFSDGYWDNYYLVTTDNEIVGICSGDDQGEIFVEGQTTDQLRHNLSIRAQLKLGLLSQEEVEAREKKKEEDNQASTLRHELEQYERLKAKFEPRQGDLF